MKSNDCFKLEGGNLQFLLTPSNSIANYIYQCNSMVHNNCGTSPTLPSTGFAASLSLQSTNDRVITLPTTGFVASLSLIQRSLATDRICSFFGDFSQPTACNAVGFEECSST